MRRLGLLKPATQARPERAFLRLAPPFLPSIGFWPRRAACEYPSTTPLAYPAKTCCRAVSMRFSGIAQAGCLCRRHVAKRYGCFAFGCPVFCLWENRMLGEALCRGRSPELTRSAVLVFGGSVSTPFRGSVVMDVFVLNVNKVKTYICGCV